MELQVKLVWMEHKVQQVFKVFQELMEPME